MTNGTGMMKFNKGFMRFASELPVVPVALRASLPWGISTHTINSSFLMNMFWCVRISGFLKLPYQKGKERVPFAKLTHSKLKPVWKVGPIPE